MSEKRFICGLGFPINSDDPIRIISDSVEDKDYYKFSDICNVLNEQQATIKQLQRKCFELEKDYLIETSDISDKIYLDDELKELKKKYGVTDE